jgi:hypothetical protein
MRNLTRSNSLVLGLGSALFGSAVACGGVVTDSEGRSVERQEAALILPVQGLGQVVAQRGTSLPAGSAGIPSVEPPRTTAFTLPAVNVRGQTAPFQPADPNGDVGRHHYVHAFNSRTPVGAVFTVYDKLGQTLSPDTTNVPLNQLVTTAGPCSVANGDPIVNYDHLADRWVMTQLAFPRNLCVYVSETSNPAAIDRWILYDFDMSTLVDVDGNPAPGQFPDYAKLAVWPGAYYVSANDAFYTEPNEVGAYALERSAMLAGSPTRIQRFVAPRLDIPGVLFQPLTAVDLDGRRPPPAGTPGMFVRRVDDELLATPGSPDSDRIELWQLSPDFSSPSSSSLVGPTTIPTGDFDTHLCSLFLHNACAEQPGTQNLLSVVGAFVVLWRAAYQNFGDHETLVGLFDVDADDLHPSPHWFELRQAPGEAWSLVQEQTYAPDASDRWTGGVSMDRSGNVALGYNISNAITLFPSVAYTGRQATDPPGTLPEPETFTAQGAASQTSETRWGEGSTMQVDPTDECTFWYTNSYYEAPNVLATRISALRFPYPTCLDRSAACVQTAQSLTVADSAIVESGAQGGSALVNTGGDAIQIGVGATVGDLVSVGPVTLADRATVNGLIQTRSTVQWGNDVLVTGPIATEANLNLPPAIDLSDVVFPADTQGDVNVWPDGQAALPPGSYARVTVYSRSELRLSSGTYYFRDLDLEPQGQLVLDESAGPVVILVESSIIYRGGIVLPDGTPASVYLGYLGTQPVTLEMNFTGTLIAPNAPVALGADEQLSFRGQFVARTFELRPRATLTCDTSASDDREPWGASPPTCDDGVMNGAESDIDCGGGTCPACADGLHCRTTADCQTGDCLDGVCQSPPESGELEAGLVVTTDWGSGFCVTLDVTNGTSQPTTNWRVDMDASRTTVVTSWNGTFSGSSGTISITPLDWNRVIAPGATNSSVGLCANRTTPGTQIPVVLGVTGSF